MAQQSFSHTQASDLKLLPSAPKNNLVHSLGKKHCTTQAPSRNNIEPKHQN